MKKRLIKPPRENGEVLFLPGAREFLNSIGENTVVGVCHQPYFFNPGVSLKFLFLENLPAGRKDLVFLDIDRVRLGVKVPQTDGSVGVVDLINSERVLRDYPAPGERALAEMFSSMEDGLKKAFFEGREEALSNLSRFREIVLRRAGRRYLKEILAESFLEYYNIGTGYSYLSDLIAGEEFEEFFMRIYSDAAKFRETYNNALDEFREEYRFRYRHYPFPPLEEGELPFWIVEDGIRKRFHESDIGASGMKGLTVFPRAATLTIFIRLYRFDLFIHGTGGANYEWVQDRIIERFFEKTPPPYAVLSGTFLLGGFEEREFPYFFFSPQRIRQSIGEKLLRS